jgi:hypothetical protein
VTRVIDASPPVVDDVVVDWIGELWQAFLTSLYGLRVPIAIGTFVGFVVFVWIARRRGWLAAARRHPARAAALAVVLLAVGLPTAWYLGSPLFIRTALEEPLPSPSAKTTPSPAVVPTEPAMSSGPLATVTPTTPGATLQPPRTGQFTGADEFHFGRGTASLIETAPGTWIVRFEDFSVRNGPDLYVYLSPKARGNGDGDGVLELGTLKATDGNFNYEVPAGTDVSGFNSVVVWCKQFAVLFAVAPLG